MKRWLKQKRLEIFFFAAIAVGAFVILYLPLHQQATGCFSYEVAPSRTEQHQGQAQSEQTGTEQAQKSNAAQAQQQQSNDDRTKTNIDQRTWISTASCNWGITDIALVFFTYCLVIVGWITMRSNEMTLREIERARLFGGPLPDITALLDGTFEIGFIFTNTGPQDF